MGGGKLNIAFELEDDELDGWLGFEEESREVSIVVYARLFLRSLSTSSSMALTSLSRSASEPSPPISSSRSLDEDDGLRESPLVEVKLC